MVYRKKSKSSKTVSIAPKQKKAIKQIVKKEIKSTEETKIYSTGSATSTNLVSSTIYTLAPCQLINQGTNNNNRIGNDIYLQGIKLHMLFQNRAQQTLFFRISVIWHIDQWNGNWSYNGSAIGSTEIWYTSSNVCQAPFNTKNTGTQVLYDKVFNVSTTVNNGVTPYYKQTMFKKYIKINKKLTYLAGSQLFKNKQLYILVTPFSLDSGITQGVSSVGAIDSHALLYFKDA